MLRYSSHLFFSITIFLCCSCGQNHVNNAAGGAIILGDSSTIVTETDSQFLKDNIPDIEVGDNTADTINKLTQADTTPVKPIDTPVTKPTATINGYNIDIGDATIIFTGITPKESKKQNTQQSNDLSYTLSSGNISNAKIVVSGAKNVAIQQRYQSGLDVKLSSGTIGLDKLGYYTSGWQKLSGKSENGNPTFTIQGLAESQYASVTNAKIKNATEQALKAKRKSSKDIQKLLREVANMRSANDNPGNITIKNVQWSITGTDSKGKVFRKNVRIDL